MKRLLILFLSVLTIGMLFGSYTNAHRPYYKNKKEIPVSSLQKLPNLPKFGDFVKVKPANYEGMVVLSKGKDKFCSGSVIDNHYILTAAHCLINDYGVLETSKIEVVDIAGRYTGVTGIPAGVNLRLDYGIIIGDFQEFKFIGAQFSTPGFDDAEHIIACGFPGVQKQIVCVELTNVKPYNFMYSANGQLVPGMSGGPVFKIVKNQAVIVAVNSAVDGDIPSSRQPANVLVAPILGALGSFDLD